MGLPSLGFLGRMAANAITPATNVLAANQQAQANEKQQAIARQIQLMQMQREQEKQDLLRQSTQSTVGMNAAHTKLYDAQAAAGKAPKVVFSQEGAPYEVTPQGLKPAAILDGTTPATTQGAQPGQSAGPLKDPGGDIDLRNPSAASSPSPGPNQQATKPPQGVPVTPRPKFGPRAQSIVGSPEWKAAEQYKASLRPPPQGAFTFPTITVDGKPVVARANTHTGVLEPTEFGAKGTGAGGLAAPMAAKVGQAGEMLKKAADVLPMMEQIDISLGSSAAGDIAQHGIGMGHARIPGTQGLGAIMANRTPAFTTYNAAVEPLVLAAAHALSGARINEDQRAALMRSVKIDPGESPESRAQKKKNLVDLVNSVTGSLPADAMAEQESQMSPEQLSVLSMHGYKSRVGAAQPPAGGGHAAPARSAAPSAAPAGELTAAQKARAAADPTYAAFLKAKGQLP